MFEEHIAGAIRLFTDEQLQAIDPQTLNMQSPSRCVLGQVFGNYLIGKNKLRLTWTDCVLYGFDLPASRDHEWPQLQAEWRAALQSRSMIASLSMTDSLSESEHLHSATMEESEHPRGEATEETQTEER